MTLERSSHERSLAEGHGCIMNVCLPARWLGLASCTPVGARQLLGQGGKHSWGQRGARKLPQVSSAQLLHSCAAAPANQPLSPALSPACRCIAQATSAAVSAEASARDRRAEQEARERLFPTLSTAPSPGAGARGAPARPAGATAGAAAPALAPASAAAPAAAAPAGPVESAWGEESEEEGGSQGAQGPPGAPAPASAPVPVPTKQDRAAQGEGEAPAPPSASWLEALGAVIALLPLLRSCMPAQLGQARSCRG